MTKNHSTHAHALYRFYGDTGQLLYVGISNDPGRRLGQHAATKTWWQAVRGISIEWYTSREDALAAETRAIHVERPLANVVRPSMPATTQWRCGHCWHCKRDEPCILVRELEEDEERAIEPCDICGKVTCQYAWGLAVGQQDGFSVGWDAATRRAAMQA